MTALDPARPAIAIIGAGAIGGYYGAKLVDAGQQVHWLARSDYDALRSGGLHIRSDREPDRHIEPDRIRVYRDPKELPAIDLVLVCLKTTANDAFEPLIGPLVRAHTKILTIQNGLGNEDALADLFGIDRVAGGMAFICVQRVGPARLHHIDHGFLKIGEADPSTSPSRIESIASMFRDAGVKCDVLPKLRRGRWEKLVWNIPFNGLGAALGLPTDAVLRSPAGRQLAHGLMTEVMAVAAADGYSFPADLIEQQIEHTASMGAYRTSMQLDREAGRPLEVEAILGEPLRLARRLGVATPTLQTLYEQVCMVDPAGLGG